MLTYKEFCTTKTLVALGLGQFLSLLITSTGFSSSGLARRGINAPTSQSFLNYVFLAIVYGSIMVHRKQALKAKWYYYAILSLVDVEANFLGEYITLVAVRTSGEGLPVHIDHKCHAAGLLVNPLCYGSLTWFFLSTKYRFKKIAGVVVCVAGLVMVVFSDVHAGDRSGGSNPCKGDAHVIAGATLYAISNVSEEFLVKNADRVELMSLLGFFWCHNQCHSNALPFFGFAVSMFLFYSLVPILLKISGSTMLNLSLLTSDMWAVMIRIFAYHEKMYFLAFAAVAVGLIVYSGGDKEEDQHRAYVVDEDAECSSKHFDEEACSGNRNQRTILGSSKTGDSSKLDLGSTGIGDGQDIENKNVGKDVWGKKS